MRPQTEELLYFLLWSADTLMRPTWRNLNDSFETWAWRNRLTRRLAELERQKLIERHPEPSLERIVRLTEQGRRLALGGRDPVSRWSRPWDGQWRLILFDLPVARTDLRQKFWRVLRQHHFGCLQGSVWTSPDTAVELRTVMDRTKVEAEAFLVMEGRPAAGESDREIVEAAWDFPSIDRRYKQYLSFLKKPPPLDGRLPEWARRENAAWRAAMQLDPLLPRELLPNGYSGMEALRRRKEVFAELANHTNAPAFKMSHL